MKSFTTAGTLGNRIAIAREAMNISRAELARRLYVDRTVVSRWESDSRIPDAVQVQRVAKALRVPIADLLAED